MAPELWGERTFVGKGLGLWDSVLLRAASTHWNVPGEYGLHGEVPYFLIKEEQVAASNEVLPNPCVSAETLEDSWFADAGGRLRSGIKWWPVS